MTRVLVCGGRDYDRRDFVFGYLDAWHEQHWIVEIVQGEATGADRWAKLWAQGRQVMCTGCRADWAKHGRAAGPLRNQKMLDNWPPDVVIAFPGGAGTLDMILRARAGKFPVVRADVLRWT